ncbi:MULTISPECIES: hypothetical protein [Bradyrhizobium]|jgi:hypothetical protein|uniref:hypothetical protein n=1 Tax=Bradyrhizobium TaxID=374 RepID=UPI001FDA6964|nr:MULTISPECIES: hypothetical protein [Bradyrhizobium]MCS3559968.1 hypothetical protein [Bradyrhizobium elkanii]MCW2359756.1 hypothetical protein [Bradyrhizobium elkanii]MDI2052912.1 hypothetical protein [Bradyrhizobium sp. Mp19]MDI2103513.1 hypothetical protein [Bradyrhizobium sp. Mp64]WLB03787.1 hypothetical protein QNJ80_18125 [Bradyrhizobium elkanii]
MTGIETREDWVRRRLSGRGPIVARLLSLAAAPTFAVMALIAAMAPADMICSAMQRPLSLQGMVPMYALMSAFHLAPWLRLFR